MWPISAPKLFQKFSSTGTYLGVLASSGLDEPYGWLSTARFPCAGQTSSFDVTFPLAASVPEVRFDEAQKVIWERTHD